MTMDPGSSRATIQPSLSNATISGNLRLLVFACYSSLIMSISSSYGVLFLLLFCAHIWTTVLYMYQTVH